MTDDAPPEPKRRRWRWLVVGLLVSAGLVVSLRTRGYRTERAKAVRIGMTRADVRKILGRPNMWYRQLKNAGDTLEIGECFDGGSPFNVYIEEIGLKVGIRRSPRSRAKYPIEIQYDKTDHVVSIRLPEENKGQ